MTADPSSLAAKLSAHHGVIDRRQLLALGYTDHEIVGLIRRGILVAAGRGVYSTPIVSSSLWQRAAVACAQTGGALRFPTAGKVWELRKTPPARDIHIVVPWRRKIVPLAGVRIHRTRALPKADLVRRRDGLVVTTPQRTIVDAAATVGPLELESMIEDALYRRLFTVPSLDHVARRLIHPCRDGSALIGEILRARNGSLGGSASDYELRLERALRDRGFPEFVRQAPVRLPAGDVVHPDLGLPRDGFYIEIDHRRWHGQDSPIAYDTWRDRQIRLLGFSVERVSDEAIDERLAETVDDLYAAWTRARAGLRPTG